MSIHLCPSPECQATHREQDIVAYRNVDDPPTFTRYEIPEVTPEMVEAQRKLFATLWGVSLELVEVVEGYTIDSGFWPAFKLAKGWKFENVTLRPDERTIIVQRIVVKDEDDKKKGN